MKNYKEMADSVLQRRSEILQQNKKRKQKVIATVSCCCVIALLGAGVWKSGILERKPLILPSDPFSSQESVDSSNITVDSGSSTHMESGKASSQTSKPPQSSGSKSPTSSKQNESQGHGSASSAEMKPATVYSTVPTTYEEAKRLFGHPVVPCKAEGFAGYELAFLSPSGNVSDSSARCLAVIYLFQEGQIELEDQSRLGAGARRAYDDHPSEEYKGYTFWNDSVNNIVYCPLQNNLILIAKLNHKEPNDIYDMMLTLIAK